MRTNVEEYKEELAWFCEITVPNTKELIVRQYDNIIIPDRIRELLIGVCGDIAACMKGKTIRAEVRGVQEDWKVLIRIPRGEPVMADPAPITGALMGRNYLCLPLRRED